MNVRSFLDTSIEYLKGVGPVRAALLEKELGIRTFKDLLYHFPYRYIDTSALNNVAGLHDGMDYVQLRGVITNFRYEGSGARKRLVADFSDKSGTVELVWFQGASYIERSLHPGVVYNLFGRINVFNGQINIPHPELEVFEPGQATQVKTAIPMYPSTEKLRNKGLNNRQLGKLTRTLLEQYLKYPPDELLPEYILKSEQLIGIREALSNIHFPKSDAHLQAAKHRLKFQEFLAAQLKIQMLKLSHQKYAGWVFQHVGEHFNNFYNNLLPFPLTNAQKRVIKEIRKDTLTGYQMNRLLQGDVGSGKTIVALLTMLIAIDNGFQACIMAPTEILAQQHFKGMQALLEATGITIKLLTGSVKGKERKEILQSLADGSLNIIVGTHALVEDKVVFKNLGLAIVDEQHRFGVAQRSKLWTKNVKPPHILVMTATPIPRTLAMTLYGDLDVSVIDELPPGRKPITTIHRNEMYRAQVMEFARSEIAKGRQVYIVYPLIHESEKLDYENLMAGYEQVRAYFPEPKYHVAMVHGKQDNETKESNMRKFVSGHAHILVSTTVIEVGVNVPNASVMIIESAERFGLSQLHQLRGRVGRGAEHSYCILLTTSKLSAEGRKRMQIMESTQNGFVIAEEDLKLRGPGDIFGTKQSGSAIEFKLADIVHDVDLIELTRDVAKKILSADAQLSHPQHKSLHQLLAFYSEDSSGTRWNRIS